MLHPCPNATSQLLRSDIEDEMGDALAQLFLLRLTPGRLGEMEGGKSGLVRGAEQYEGEGCALTRCRVRPVFGERAVEGADGVPEGEVHGALSYLLWRDERGRPTREEALGERGPAEVEEGNYHKGRDAGTACIDKEVQE